ncbi:MAG: type III-B CRISPR module RAMP protein Cmr4 [Bacteroidia bacterium]|nr:type III-B CRISPR module RAMP protein Cmr4 [Bacteroidia bacterium]
MNNSSAYFRALIGLRTLTPLHAGIMGGSHVLDRPIHRDVHRNWPKLSSNALKGALREQDIASKRQRDLIFGSEEYLLSPEEEGTEKARVGKAGLLSFSDARLLLFPVRSARGGWAWVTCPAALLQLREEAALAGWEAVEAAQDFYRTLENGINDRAVYAGSLLSTDASHLLLYQHVFQIDARLSSEHINLWKASIPLLLEIEDLAERLVILSDDNFGAITQLYTETTTRNKIHDNTFSTGGGTLFTEEHLPANALLYALAFSMPDTTHQALASLINMNPKPIQVGGNATLGRGRCMLTWYTPNPETQRI